MGVDGPKNGVGLFLIDRRRRTASPLAVRYNAIGPEELNPVSTFTYKAADGLDIPAYLTLPRGREAKALALVVLAHGGLAARDTPGFDWWAQALASRGHAAMAGVTLDADVYRCASAVAGVSDLSRPATRIALLEAQVAFLEKHNPPN